MLSPTALWARARDPRLLADIEVVAMASAERIGRRFDADGLYSTACYKQFVTSFYFFITIALGVKEISKLKKLHLNVTIEQRQRSSLLFGGQNLFNSLPR